MPAESPRAAAARRLLRVEQDRAHAARLAGGADDPGDARLASELVAGVTRHRRRLDFVLARFYRGDPGQLDPLLRQVLRVGLYELLVRGTPPHAAVSEAVKAARALLHPGAASLANGLLRAVARASERGELPEPATGDPAEDLAVRESHPTWLVRRWLDRYGEAETLALLRAGNAAPAFGLRVNVLKTTVEALGARLDGLGVGWRRSRYLDDFVVVERLQPVLRAGLLDEGLCAVQDEAAGLVVRVLDPRPGERVLDGAAAPGGKAVYAAQRMGDRGEVVAVDPHEARTALVRRAAEAQGVTIVRAVAADLRAFEAEAPFDRVLLDAPCTGLGVLAKRADLRWNRRPEDLAALTALQDALLDAAARHVRPGGLLVYATCTLEPEENAGRVAAFLGRHPAFRREPVGDLVPEAMRTPEGDYAALPHVHGTDGAYAARLRREA
ncbi:MAG TPA: 16S rRNA (cytosine(967)-C(5))-methyltransferase RsmB [Rubricoccaceae bacterium]|nr:16S rRNA (cytosine(967)-C(5))-methyltransferase RsmB [Rubricoccaceae bacterium]